MRFEAEVRGGVVAGFDAVSESLSGLRASTLQLASELTADDWQRPSRCHLWSVHDVVRHVRDGSRRHIEMLQGNPPEFRPDDPFDNQKIALRWLADSEGESPNDTIRDLERFVPEELTALRSRAEAGGDQLLVGPYGRAHWTVLTTHLYWDSWLHARDITEAIDRPHLANERQDLVAAAYGLLVASIPSMLTGDELGITVRLRTTSDRLFDVEVATRHVALTPARTDEAADLEGELTSVADALAGRGPLLDTVLAGDTSQRAALMHLREFMVPKG